MESNAVIFPDRSGPVAVASSRSGEWPETALYSPSDWHGASRSLFANACLPVDVAGVGERGQWERVFAQIHPNAWTEFDEGEDDRSLSAEVRLLVAKREDQLAALVRFDADPPLALEGEAVEILAECDLLTITDCIPELTASGEYRYETVVHLALPGGSLLGLLAAVNHLSCAPASHG